MSVWRENCALFAMHFLSAGSTSCEPHSPGVWQYFSKYGVWHILRHKECKGPISVSDLPSSILIEKNPPPQKKHVLLIKYSFTTTKQYATQNQTLCLPRPNICPHKGFEQNWIHSCPVLFLQPSDFVLDVLKKVRSRWVLGSLFWFVNGLADGNLWDRKSLVCTARS